MIDWTAIDAHFAAWNAALAAHGLRNCTIRNDGDVVMTLPVGSNECLIELAPGEQMTLRTVER